MIQAVLVRYSTGDQGTVGKLLSPAVDLEVWMMELPNRQNRTGLSRIPAGEYQCVPYNSPKFGRVWMVKNVPGRSAVLIHKGNLAGDITKGWKTHSRGCLLPAWVMGKIGKQQAGLNSTRAFTEMKTKIGENPFTLKIVDLC